MVIAKGRNSKGNRLPRQAMAIVEMTTSLTHPISGSTSSPSPKTKKSKKSAKGSGLDVAVGPPAKMRGQEELGYQKGKKGDGKYT